VAQPGRERRAHLARQLVVAQQVEVQAAGQQDVAQVDDAQQDGDVAPRARHPGGREQQVARGLQALGQHGLVAHPGLQRVARLVGLGRASTTPARERSSWAVASSAAASARLR
jgi:hypothetical protein